MAAIVNSPRRILGNRDVNTPLLSSPSKAAILKTPGKKSALYLEADNVLRDGVLNDGLLSQKMGSRINSPSSGIKRRAACMEDPKDGSPRKQVIIGLVDWNKENDIAKGASAKPRALGTSAPRAIVDIALQEQTGSTTQILRLPPSPKSLDHTSGSIMDAQDSIMVNSQTSFEDSQDTVITVPDETTPTTVTPLIVAPNQAITSGGVSADEVRRNAATLKAKLQLAKYKVKTGQEGTPFEQLQARKPPASPARHRKTLPSNSSNKTPPISEQPNQRDITSGIINAIGHDAMRFKNDRILEHTTPRKNLPDTDSSFTRPDHDNSAVQEHLQAQQERSPSGASPSISNGGRKFSWRNQDASMLEHIITSVEVENEAVESLVNLMRKPSEIFPAESTDSSSSDSDLELPSRK